MFRLGFAACANAGNDTLGAARTAATKKMLLQGWSGISGDCGTCFTRCAPAQRDTARARRVGREPLSYELAGARC